jgi:hypothetical protein
MKLLALAKAVFLLLVLSAQNNVNCNNFSINPFDQTAYYMNIEFKKNSGRIIPFLDGTDEDRQDALNNRFEPTKYSEDHPIFKDYPKPYPVVIDQDLKEFLRLRKLNELLRKQKKEETNRKLLATFFISSYCLVTLYFAFRY